MNSAVNRYDISIRDSNFLYIMQPFELGNRISSVSSSTGIITGSVSVTQNQRSTVSFVKYVEAIVNLKI